MPEKIICPNCGQENRIPDDTIESRIVCEKCWTFLVNIKSQENITEQQPDIENNSFETMPESAPPLSKKTILALTLTIIVLVAVVLSTIDFDKAAPPANTLDLSSMSDPAESDDYYTDDNYVAQEEEMPDTGDFLVYNDNERHSPFIIKTKSGDNFFVKLVNSSTGEDEYVFTIKGGETLITNVALGSYKMKCASGGKWYGLIDLFGTETQYFQLGDVFTFDTKDNNHTGHSVTLYSVSDGNMGAQKINEEDFQ